MKKVVWVLLASFAFSTTVLAMEENLSKRTREGELVKDNPSKVTLQENGLEAPNKRACQDSVIIDLTKAENSYSESYEDSEFFEEFLDNSSGEEVSTITRLTPEKIKEILLDKEDDRGELAKMGITYLHLAAKKGSIVCLKAFLQSEGVDVEQKDVKGRTPLHMAVIAGKIASVKTLLKAGANKDAQDKEGWTPLHLAAANGWSGIVDLLLKEKADWTKRSHDDERPLHIAARFGKLECLKALIKTRKGSINAKGNQGRTALYEAAKNGYIDCVNEIIRTGVKVGIEELQVALKNDHRECVKALLEDISQKGVSGALLMLAVKKGYKEAVEAFIAENADLEEEDKDGQTVLVWAAIKGNQEIIEMLIKAGANVELKAIKQSILKTNLGCLRVLLDSIDDDLIDMGYLIRWALKEKKWAALLELVGRDYARNMAYEDEEESSFLIEGTSISVPGEFFRISGTLKAMAEETGQTTKIPIPDVTLETWNLLHDNIDLICSLSLKVDLIKKRCKKDTSSASHERVTIQSSNEEIQEELARLAGRRSDFLASDAYKALKKELADRYKNCTRKQASQILSLANYLEIPFLMDVFTDILQKLYVKDVFAIAKKEVHKDLRKAFLLGVKKGFDKRLRSVKK